MRRFLTRAPDLSGKADGLIGMLPGTIPQSANLKAWWRADSGLFQDSALTTPAVNDGDQVGGWVDRFAAAPATQTANANRGTLRLAKIGGQPAVQFAAASDQWLKNTTLAAAFSGAAVPKTWIVVVQLASLPAAVYVLFGGGVAATAAQDLIRANVGVWSHRQVDDTGASLIQSGGVLDLKPHIFAGRFNGAVVDLRLDGLTIAAAPGLTTSISIAEVDIGARTNGNNPSDSFIAEAVAYNAALSGASMSSWELYLSRRYGIPLL